MPADDLRSFLHLLEQADQLARIGAVVDPCEELATIVELVSKGAGRHRGLLFENVRGAAMPVAANLYGSLERVAWAIGTTDLEGLARRLAADLAVTGTKVPSQALDAICGRSVWQAAIISNPEWRAQDVSRQGLQFIPPLKAWSGDGGAFLTLPQVYTRHPDGSAVNCGMYRIQCHDSHTATIRCRPGSGAAQHLTAWHERGKAMPVAVALGGPPILTWAAAVSLPEGVDEIAFCGYLQERRIAMSACQTSDLCVPASAELVIEGSIEPGAVAPEGPFGNHTGVYDRAAAAPRMTVLAVHARSEAIYPWTLVGPPPRENIQLARATACLLQPLVKMAVPAVRRIHLPDEGIFHRAALITVDAAEQRPLEELACLLWETPLLKGSRLLVVGADDHDPQDLSAVFWRVLNRVDWQRDLLITGSQLAVDARRLPAADLVRRDPAVEARVLERWREFGLGGSGE